MKQIKVGIFGSSGHGKSTLFDALLGTKSGTRKGLPKTESIPGFRYAPLRMPDGSIAELVDIPGEDPLSSLGLAEIMELDAILLVVAADEGISLQTREYLDILNLLDSKHAIAVLTKVDLADRDLLSQREAEVRALLDISHFKGAPVLWTAAKTGRGIEALKRALFSLLSRTPERSYSAPFRLRIATITKSAGAGVVVTGTLLSGTLQPGDLAQLLPGDKVIRVRGIQEHGQKVKLAAAGSHITLNLPDLEPDELSVGTQLTLPGVMIPSFQLDGSLRLLSSLENTVQDKTAVCLQIGGMSVPGRLALLDSREELAAGDQSFIRFEAEIPFAASRGDRFIVRERETAQILGGGVVLIPNSPAYVKDDQEVLQQLQNKLEGDPADLLSTLLLQAPAGIWIRDLPSLTGLSEDAQNLARKALDENGELVLLPDESVIHRARLNELADRVRELLSRYHEKNPQKFGMPREELRSRLGKEFESKHFLPLQSHWQRRNVFLFEGTTIRLPGFRVQLNDRQQALLDRIAVVYAAALVEIPTLELVSREVNAPPDAVIAMLKVGEEQGLFAKAADGEYYHAQSLQRIKDLVSDWVREHGAITVGDFRDLTSTNRRFALQALEYLDTIGFTRREGNDRTLAE